MTVQETLQSDPVTLCPYLSNSRPCSRCSWSHCASRSERLQVSPFATLFPLLWPSAPPPTSPQEGGLPWFPSSSTANSPPWLYCSPHHSASLLGMIRILLVSIFISCLPTQDVNFLRAVIFAHFGHGCLLSALQTGALDKYFVNESDSKCGPNTSWTKALPPLAQISQQLKHPRNSIKGNNSLIEFQIL